MRDGHDHIGQRIKRDKGKGMEFRSVLLLFFFFNDTATTEIYTLSLHDALPIYSDTVNTEGDEHRQKCVCPSQTHVVCSPVSGVYIISMHGDDGNVNGTAHNSGHHQCFS